MNRRALICCLLALWPTVALLQVPITEPPEFAGPTKSYPTVSDKVKAFGKAIEGNWNTPEELQQKHAALDQLIARFPDSADAYYMRAMLGHCLQKTETAAAVLADVEKAIALRLSLPKEDIEISSIRDMRGLRARLEFERKDFAKALEELDAAIIQDPANGDDLLNTGEVDPTTSSEPCKWNRTDLDALVARYPTDPRPLVARGLYYQVFARLKPEYSKQAIADMTRATALATKNAIVPYLLGRIQEGQGRFLSPLTDTQKAAAKAQAVAAYSSAIRLDPKLAVAHAARASLYYERRQFSESIRDFDAALALVPRQSAWLNDRGLAKLESGNAYSAISDFTAAIAAKGAFGENVEYSYENRADANAKIGRFDQAALDMTEAIRVQLATAGLLMNLSQLRKLYPEYQNLPDRELLLKLYRMAYANMDFDGFAKMISNNTKGVASTVLPDRYVKRADNYLAANNYRAALNDYKRVADAFPDSTQYVDRWRPLFHSTTDDWFIDGRTAETSQMSAVTFWVKTISTAPKTKGKASVMHYSVSCTAKTISTLSAMDYDADGSVAGSRPYASAAQPITPDTIGESLYLGICESRKT